MFSRSVAVALVATVGAAVVLALQPEDAPPVVAAVARPTSAAPAPAPPSAPRPRGAWPDADARALLAWGAAAAPAAAPVPAAPASASPPEFPYRWIGRLDDGEAAQALLAGAQRSLGVRAGDVLEGRWRVDAVEPSRLQLTWLPSGVTVAVAYPR